MEEGDRLKIIDTTKKGRRSAKSKKTKSTQNHLSLRGCNCDNKLHFKQREPAKNISVSKAQCPN